jgi:Na+-driven multidrug efflux pump
MHHAGNVGIMPVQLSYSGYNFDIVTGIGALLILTLLKSGRSISRSVLWAWNVWGSFCLVVIAIIAITTSPVIRLFGDDPHNLNTWVLYFPYVWLPVVLVTVAISSHIVITRKLMKGD